jgi:hypothetical protein
MMRFHHYIIRVTDKRGNIVEPFHAWAETLAQAFDMAFRAGWNIRTATVAKAGTTKQVPISEADILEGIREAVELVNL